MSNFEIFLIVGLSLAPIVALFFVLPKKLKKEKKEPPKTTEYKPEEKSEPIKQEEPKEVKPEKKVANIASTSEFKDYLTYKKENLHAPKHLESPKDVFVSDYFPSRFKKKPKEDKTIAEQINDLSPELKVMMLSGVFNRKDFD